MTGWDAHRLGELLQVADISARQALMEVTGDDAPALLRTWGEVVEAAADLWSALSQATGVPTAPPVAAPMTQLVLMARALHRTSLRTGWPGDGATDERLTRVAGTFDRATAVAARGAASGAAGPADASDLEAVRTRVMRTLYVGAHGVRVALRDHLWDLQWAATRSHRADPPGLAQGQDAAQRLAAFEHLAGAHAGNHPRRIGDPATSGTVRLEEALVGWDIQAHRTLAAAPTAANVLLATRVQASIATAAIGVLEAGVRSGRVDADAYQHRLSPTLELAQRAWTQAAARWAELVHPTDRTDRTMVQAANAVHAAVRELTHDGAIPAGPEVVASRVDIGAATRTLQQALSAAVDVAYLSRDIAASDRGLTGPAQAMTRRATAERPTAEDDDVVWVDLSDVHANRLVPVPDPVRDGLVAASDTVVRAASTAVSAAACLDRTPPKEEAALDAVHAPTNATRRHKQHARVTTPTPSPAPHP